MSNPMSEHVYENLNSVIEDVILDNAYLRKKMVVNELMLVQESNSNPKNELDVKNAFFVTRT